MLRYCHFALALGLLAAAAHPAAAQHAPGEPLHRTPFTWRSDRGDFSVTLGGYIQTAFEYFAPAEGEETSGPLVQDLGSLRMRRGRVAVSGFVYRPDLEYKVQVELAGSALSLRDAYLTWKPHGSAAQLRLGQFKAPVGRQMMTSIFKQQAVDRALAAGEFGHGWDAGLMVLGKLRGGVLEYYAGAFNGEGQNQGASADASPMEVVRLVWAPLGPVSYSEGAVGAPDGLRVAVGASGSLNGGWFHDVNGAPGLQAPRTVCVGSSCAVDHGDDASVRGLGVDGVATLGGRLSVTGEYFVREVAPRDATLSTRTDEGWYVDTGWMVVPAHHELGLRVGRLDTVEDVRELTPFYSYYLAGHGLKIQADYSILTHMRDAAPNLEDHRVRLQVVASF